jgi:NAD(P)-dependent dehydrogenase (short-subunit alcohol dehydrogenase family)
LSTESEGVQGAEQRKVVIVGGTSGIGFATARLLAHENEQVTVVGRNSQTVHERIRELGRSTRGETADAGDRSAMDALFERIGTFDHLVLAASGGGGAGFFSELANDQLQHGMEAKFWVHWNAAQAALPHLAPEGSIVFITAASSRFANPGTSGLAAINGALERMVPTLARELAPRRVNAVSPGVIDTPWWTGKPFGMFESASSRAPLGRAGRPEEVAHAISFLLRNEFVTGVVLDVDGGLHLT